MTIFKACVAAFALVATGAGGVSARDEAPALVVEGRIGKAVVDGVEMSFLMSKAYDLDNEYPDDEPNFTSVREINVKDDRGTFLATVETLEKWCRSEPHPMNVDLEKFKKLKGDWLKNRATAANYKKASKEFKSIRIKPIEAQTDKDYDWQVICNDVNDYAMELKIFKHLPDAEWSRYEAEPPAWMGPGVSGTYPYIDQVKFTAYPSSKVGRFCSSAPNMDRDKWRLVRGSRLTFTINRADAEQMKAITHYAALIDQARQRIEWKQARDGDIGHLALVCIEYGGMVSTVNGQ